MGVCECMGVCESVGECMSEGKCTVHESVVYECGDV